MVKHRIPRDFKPSNLSSSGYEVFESVNPVYTDWGLASANFLSDGRKIIYLNRHLQSEPELHDSILEHELNHINSKHQLGWRINLQDIKADLFGDFNVRIFFKSILFMLRHPKTLIEFLPITLVEGEIGVKPLLLIGYFLILFKLLLFP